MYLGWIEDHYAHPFFHFKYFGFEWVNVPSSQMLYLMHILMILAALGIMLLQGWLYRASAIAFFVLFSYTELIDLTYYLNHYYFVSIISFLLIFSPAHISPFYPVKTQQIPRIALLIIQIHIAILYVYAGLAKINYDWLIQALPLKIWVPAHDQLPLIGPIFTWQITPYLFSWFGMLYDTFIILFLLYKPTRKWAYITVIIFHTLTGIMFQIGVFPLVMIGITLIFFSDEWQQKWIRRWIPLRHKKTPLIPRKKFTPLLHSFYILFVLFQLVFPWRYVLYSGNLFWTEEGYRFSWRVMLMEKAGTATFYVKDTQTGREGVVVNSEFLNPHQEKQMSFQPDMILQFAHFLGNYYEKMGVHKPEVRAEVYVTLNARPSQLLIDPKRDLMKEKDRFKPKDWINPYPY